MKSPNTYFASNLKFLRMRKKKTQGDMADDLEITRAKLASYESENAKNPPLEDLIKFSEYFKMSIDSLTTADLMDFGRK